MEKEITVPGFVNYTDLRENKEVCGIAKDNIKDLARGLSEEEMKLFLEEVSDFLLVNELHLRLMHRESDLAHIKRYLSI